MTQLYEITNVPQAAVEEATFEVPSSPIPMLDTELMRSGRIEADDSRTLESADKDFAEFDDQVERIMQGFKELRNNLALQLFEHASSTDELQRLRDRYDSLTGQLSSTEQNIDTTREEIDDRQHTIRLLKKTDEKVQAQKAQDDEILSRKPQNDQERLEQMNLAYQMKQPVTPPMTTDGRYTTAETTLEQKYRGELAVLEANLKQLEDTVVTLRYNIGRTQSDIDSQVEKHYRIETAKNNLNAELKDYIKIHLKSLERRIQFALKLQELGGAAIFETTETTETVGGTHAG
jgi:chromosome segregation ATPase